MLEVNGLTRRFGGVIAVDDVSLSLPAGQLQAIIGPNGAGKSTLFHMISGHLSPHAGDIMYEGASILGMAPHRRAQHGIGIVFQGVRTFDGMTVLENVMTGAHAWTHHGFVDAAIGSPRHRREEVVIRRAAEEALERVGLTAHASSAAELLPLGVQRTVQLARALCGKPRLLLLDEPAAKLITVLDQGRLIARGTPLEIRANPAVTAAYLGQERASA